LSSLSLVPLPCLSCSISCPLFFSHSVPLSLSSSIPLSVIFFCPPLSPSLVLLSVTLQICIHISQSSCLVVALYDTPSPSLSLCLLATLWCMYVCVCQQVIFRNDRFWHLLLSSILGTEDTLSAFSMAAGFGPISFMSDEWINNPARVEAARISSRRGGLISSCASAARAAAMGVFCNDGVTGDGLGFCLIGNRPLFV